MTDKEQLNQAIEALEAQRAILGDAVVETSLNALPRQLRKLEAAGRSSLLLGLMSVTLAAV